MAQGPGKPKHQPTIETRAEVAALSTYGVRQDDIANYIGVSAKTLRKRYRDELDKGRSTAHESVGKFLYNTASGNALQGEDGATYSDCVRAAMFWAKTQMGWRETENHNLTSEDGSMSPAPNYIEIVGYTGDNGQAQEG